MKFMIVEPKAFIFTGVDLNFKLAIFISCILLCSALKSTASQPFISGSHLSSLIVGHLTNIGVRSKPVINKDRVFYGCAQEDIRIEKRALSWKTIQLTCKKK